MNIAAHKPDEFFTQEVIAEGDHIQIFVNGKKTVDFKDPEQDLHEGSLRAPGPRPWQRDDLQEGRVQADQEVTVEE